VKLTIDSPARRARMLFTLMLLALGALIARAGHLQIFRGDEFRARAHRQHFRVVDVPAQRGRILDREGRVLVCCYHSRSLAVDPKMVHDAAQKRAKREKRPVGRWATEWAARFALAFGEPERAAEFADRLRRAAKRKTRFCYLARWIDRDIAERVESASLPGMVVLEEPRREYPHGSLAASIVGVVGPDAEGEALGLSGLERMCDAVLQGQDGRSSIQRSGRSERLHLYPEHDLPPIAGRDIRTTLDVVVQRIVAEELDKLEETFEPSMACAIAMDPRTGEILAMAGRPALDPTQFPKVDRAALRIPAIHMSYEPGSTLKPLIVAEALSRNAVRFDEVFDCGPGYRKFGWRVVHDVRPHHQIELSRVLIKSSNVGMSQVGLALGIAPTHSYLSRIGFGRKTGLALKGEEPGRLTPVNEWREYEHLISMSFGRAIMVTPLQLATAFATIANGGYLVSPRLLAQRHRPEPRRVGYSREALQFVRETLTRVVAEGTGRRARIRGIDVAGKTGTSRHYLKPGESEENAKYDSSFVAFAPADDPRLLVLVVAREPKKSKTYPRPYGGVVAAPAVGRIIRRTLPVLEARLNGAPSESGVRQLVQKEKQVRVAAVQRSSAKTGERISPVDGRNPDSEGAVLCRSGR